MESILKLQFVYQLIVNVELIVVQYTQRQQCLEYEDCDDEIYRQTSE